MWLPLDNMKPSVGNVKPSLGSVRPPFCSMWLPLGNVKPSVGNAKPPLGQSNKTISQLLLQPEALLEQSTIRTSSIIMEASSQRLPSYMMFCFPVRVAS